jgi:hypothetical protein
LTYAIEAEEHVSSASGPKGWIEIWQGRIHMNLACDKNLREKGVN